MTMPERIFDPQTHRFGMAYKWISRGTKWRVCYPVGQPYKGCIHMVHEDQSYGQNEFDDLIRAPEHDLIPRAAAEKLRTALEDLANEHEQLIKRIELYEDGHKLLGGLPDELGRSKQAITEFDNAYGATEYGEK